MFKIDNKTIRCTQGDEGTINFSILKSDGTPYTFVSGDKIHFRVFDKGDYTSVLLDKEFGCTVGATSCDAAFTSADTNFTEQVSKDTTFWYEASLNDNQTFLGYDATGPKEFILYPGGE